MSKVLNLQIGQVKYRFTQLRTGQPGLCTKVCVSEGIVYALRKQTATQVDIYVDDIRRMARRQRRRDEYVLIAGPGAISALYAFGVIGAEAMKAEYRAAVIREQKQNRKELLEWYAKELGLAYDEEAIDQAAQRYAEARVTL